MKIVGLDIGTTTISGVLLDTITGRPVSAKTYPNHALLHTSQTWERLQSPAAIWDACTDILHHFSRMCAGIDGIGITGQMHGILYLDAAGNAASSLYTWQDERGNCCYRDETSYCDFLATATGYPLATGYGLVTHFYNLCHGLVPQNAVTFCSIADYIAMRLCNRKKPLVHASHAAGFGLFDVNLMQFDVATLQRAGIDPLFLPEVSRQEHIVGNTEEGIPVSMAVGDNQASVLGSVDDRSNLLVNIGTGSQLSLISTSKVARSSLEYRPYVAGSFLLVGSALCGGSSYQMVRDFFEDVLRLFGVISNENIYSQMEQAAREVYGRNNGLVIDTRFRGTRSRPALRGSIENITFDNLTAGHLSLGVMKGICREMKTFYDDVPQELKEECEYFIGSGNALRKNALIREILSETFGKKLLIPVHEEEAAFGAAILAAGLVDGRKGLMHYQNLIAYHADYSDS